MRKRIQGKKLSRRKAHRTALLRNLSQDLFLHGRIKTTLARAKALRPYAEKIITKARLGTNHAKNQVNAKLYKQEAVDKLMNEIAPKYEEEQRPGGYTRIVKLGPRQGDGVEEAVIELVESEKVEN